MQTEDQLNDEVRASRQSRKEMHEEIVSDLEQSTILTSGQLLGRVLDKKYKIVEKLGSGGMGVVYKAEHILMDRAVALKVLHFHHTDSDELVRRFQHESRVASKVAHEHAATIYDCGIDGPIVYLAMEYIEGKTLETILDQATSLPLDRVLNIFRQVCKALSYAHSVGIVHRDLKPANVMVSELSDGSEWVYVLDFGIAKVLQESGRTGESVTTKTGVFMGTPEYMAPEAAERRYDARSDIYLLGLMLYEMISGDIPFRSPSYLEVVAKHLTQKPESIKKFRPDLKISNLVDQVVMKCLEKNPDKRFDSVAKLYDAFEHAVLSSKNSAASSYKLEIKGKYLWSVLSLVLFLIIGGAFYGYSSNSIDSLPKPALFEDKPIESAIEGIQKIDHQKISAEDAVDLLDKLGIPLADRAYSQVSSLSNQSVLPVVYYTAWNPNLYPLKQAFVEPLKVLNKSAAYREAERLYQLGQKLEKQKEYLQAARYYRQALHYRSNHLFAHLSLGVCLLRLNQFELAHAEFSRALSIDPHYPPTHYNLASYFAVVKNVEKSVYHLTIAIRAFPDCKKWAAKDPDFDGIRDNPSFRNLFGR